LSKLKEYVVLFHDFSVDFCHNSVVQGKQDKKRMKKLIRVYNIWTCKPERNAILRIIHL